MPKFVIERDLPGAGSLNADEVHTITAKSNKVIADMAPRLQWVQSYVTQDKVYCVYIAQDEAALREHGERAGVPVSSVNQVGSVIDPITGE